jgi:DNA polymerase III delta prime subunit
MKLDASDDRGINSVREDIKGFAEKSNMFYCGVKLIILDEADAMTFDAQFALRRIIEKYSSTIRFCLICNYENKIIPAIRARCANFRFSNINSTFMYNKLKMISNNEKLSYDDNAIKTIAILSNGDLRKAINTLQNISMQNNHITEDLCYNVMGNITIDELNKMMTKDNELNRKFEELSKSIPSNASSTSKLGPRSASNASTKKPSKMQQIYYWVDIAMGSPDNIKKYITDFNLADRPDKFKNNFKAGNVKGEKRDKKGNEKRSKQQKQDHRQKVDHHFQAHYFNHIFFLLLTIKNKYIVQ